MDASFVKSAFKEEHYPPSDLPEVAFAGKSNVGKSSLLNVLVNRRKMARTSSIPGRTQALNFFTVGEEMYLVDLPGYGFARVPPAVKKSWGKMVGNYLKLRSNLKAVIVIMDIRRDLSSGDRDLLNWLKLYNIEAIIVLTKTDKLSKNKAAGRASSIWSDLKKLSSEKPILFSSKSRQGKEEVWERIRCSITES